MVAAVVQVVKPPSGQGPALPDGCDIARAGPRELETDLLLEGVFQQYGHDFRGYRREALYPRLRAYMDELGTPTISRLQERVLHDPVAGTAFSRAMCVRDAELFDRPASYQALRKYALPWLRSCPAPRIWLAECVCAADIVALAMLIAELKLETRVQIYATAAHEGLLGEARACALPANRFSIYERNYRISGGEATLSAYFNMRDGVAYFDRQLVANVTWSQHSLVTDASFNEFDLIVCRSTMEEFGGPLRQRVAKLFGDSLPLLGLLSVAPVVQPDASPFAMRFQTLAAGAGLYRRVQ